MIQTEGLPYTPKSWSWKEFKEAVEKQMAEQGIPETAEIAWIDWPSGMIGESPEINGSPEQGYSIS